jgi:hypothetical protein
MIELTCRSCGANLHADDVNMQAGIATCRYCDAVFAFGHAPRNQANDALTIDGPRTRPTIDRPAGFTAEEDAYRFRITQRWLSWKVIPLLVFALFWNGVVGFMITALFADFFDGSGPDGFEAVFLPLFFIPFVLIGLGFLYGIAATFINTTTVDVDDRELAVRHGPLPVTGNKTLPALDITQLYCKRHVSRTKNGTSVSYRLHAITQDGKDHKLLGNLSNQNHALYLEQQVERVLGLQDKAVAGEAI